MASETGRETRAKMCRWTQPANAPRRRQLLPRRSPDLPRDDARGTRMWQPFWVLPMAIVVTAFVLGLVRPTLDSALAEHVPFVFEGGPDGARSLLGTIASAMSAHKNRQFAGRPAPARLTGAGAARTAFVVSRLGGQCRGPPRRPRRGSSIGGHGGPVRASCWRHCCSAGCSRSRDDGHPAPVAPSPVRRGDVHAEPAKAVRECRAPPPGPADVPACPPWDAEPAYPRGELPDGPTSRASAPGRRRIQGPPLWKPAISAPRDALTTGVDESSPRSSTRAGRCAGVAGPVLQPGGTTADPVRLRLSRRQHPAVTYGYGACHVLELERPGLPSDRTIVAGDARPFSPTPSRSPAADPRHSA